MNTLFTLINFFVGIPFLLLGSGLLLGASENPLGAIAGAVALALGVTCLWLAKVAITSRERQSA
jgi:hypothetical protein